MDKKAYISIAALLPFFLISATAEEPEQQPRAEYGYIPPAVIGGLSAHLPQNGGNPATEKHEEKWYIITPLSNLHSFCHLELKVDKRGLPKSLIIGETKYGSIKQRKTKDGAQLALGRHQQSLLKLSSAYAKVSTVKNIHTGQRLPLKPITHLRVVMSNGKSVDFWKKTSRGDWYSNATPTEIQRAQYLASEYAQFFEDEGNNKITYKTRLYLVTPKGRDLVLKIFEGNSVLTNYSSLKKAIVLKNAHVHKTPSDIADDMAEGLQHHCSNITNEQLKNLAKTIQQQYKVEQMLQANHFVSNTVKRAAANATDHEPPTTPLALCQHLIDTGTCNINTALNAVSGRLVKEANSKIVTLMHNRIIVSANKSFHLKPGISNGGGAMAEAAWGYLSDNMESSQALLKGSTDVAGHIMATAAKAASGKMATRLGTAIASRSGASLTTLVSLGRGTIASGGGSAAFTSAVSGGIYTIVFSGVTSLALKAYEQYEDRQLIYFYQLMLQKLSQKETIPTILNKGQELK